MMIRQRTVFWQRQYFNFGIHVSRQSLFVEVMILHITTPFFTKIYHLKYAHYVKNGIKLLPFTLIRKFSHFVVETSFKNFSKKIKKVKKIFEI